jgi:REP element-mobilizing transposase RayT
MGMTTVMQLHSAAEGKPTAFDYRGMHRYLVTIPTFQSKPVFVDMPAVVRVLDVLRDTGLTYHFDITAYCFVPDALRILVHGRSEASDLKIFLAAFRSLSSAAMEPQLGHRLWKRRYLERVLRRGEETTAVAREIFFVPVQLGLAGVPTQYPFQGSFTSNVAAITAPVNRTRRSPFKRRR